MPCFVGKSDMKMAFRNLGLKPSQFCLVILKAKSPLDGRTYFFVEKSLSFGASISCSHFQHFSDGIADILEVKLGRKQLTTWMITYSWLF